MPHTHGLSTDDSTLLIHGHTHSPERLSPSRAEKRLRTDLDRIREDPGIEESRETLLELATLAIPVLTHSLGRALSYLSSQDSTQSYATTILEELKFIRREPERFSDSLIMSNLYHCSEVLWQLSVKAPPKLRRESLRAGQGR